MVHCDRRGSELIAGDNSHTFLFEQGKYFEKHLMINNKNLSKLLNSSYDYIFKNNNKTTNRFAIYI